jgi:dolichol-phosphate mannosyltransferase
MLFPIPLWNFKLESRSAPVSQVKTLVILPTYNEDENIGAMLSQLLQELIAVDILVVDDNSPDGTQKIVRRTMRAEDRVYLLKRPEKEGLGAAYVAGFRWAKEKGYERVVQMDADFSHSPKYVSEMLAALETHDLVIGCRYMPGGGTSGWSWLRRVISRGGNLYAQTVLRVPYHDLTGGFTAWQRPALESLVVETIGAKGYAFQVELKYRAFKKGLRILEVPILFENRKLGKSKMSGNIVWEAAFRVLALKRAMG